MTSKGQAGKWITAGLGVVCLVLVVNLVFHGGNRAATTKPGARPASSAATPARSAAERSADELARYDPAIRLDEFKTIQGRPQAKLGRDPFEFVARPVAPRPSEVAAAATSGPQAPPAPPPPPPLKALGYSEKSGGIREAIVTFQDELFVVHEGETFARRFRVTKLSPAQIEVSDETTQQTIRLPIGG
jgi:hypothetical protein